MTTRLELGQLADEAQKSADDAVLEANDAHLALVVAREAVTVARETRKASNDRAKELLKEATRARLRYLGAMGRAAEDEVEDDQAA